MELTARNLDVAARSIDLLTTLTNASSTPAISGLLEIGEWLGREKLGRHDLEVCIRKAQNLFILSQHGQTFFDDLTKGGYTNPLKHIFLKQSGSLGHLIARDPGLKWIVLTVTCLFQFYSDESLVSDVICQVIMLATNDATDTKYRNSLYSRYHPAWIQLKTVIGKMVSSIWLNVVNAGVCDMPLPEKLMEVCDRGHWLGLKDFARIMNTIREMPSHSHLIIRTHHLVRDLTLWLLYHFDGHLQITVSGAIVWEQSPEESARKIDLRVTFFCDKEACDVSEACVEISEGFRSKVDDFVQASYPYPKEMPIHPGIRKAFYTLPPYPRESAANDKEVRIMIRCAAQKIMRWLLLLPVNSLYDSQLFGFSVRTVGDLKGTRFTLSDILQKFPDMINLDWGNYTGGDVVFSGVLNEDQDEDSMPDIKTKSATTSFYPDWTALSEQAPPGDVVEGVLHKFRLTNHESRLEFIIAHFPIIQDLLAKMQRRCQCPRCREPVGLLEILSGGCLRHSALVDIFVLLAHAIADAFGCSGSSSLANDDNIFDGMMWLLTDICNELVRWDVWFSIAATVSLGCRFDHLEEECYHGGTAVAAIQHGGMVLIAPWLDLSKELTVRHCFRALEAKGRFGVRTSEGGDLPQFNGVQGDFAIIQTERTQDTSTFVRRVRHEPLTLNSVVNLDKDSGDAESDLSLQSLEAGVYRLLTRIQCGNHSRIVDPSDALLRIMYGVKPCKCQHSEQLNPRKFKVLPGYSIKLMTFSDLLGRWSSCGNFSSPTRKGEMPWTASEADEPNYLRLPGVTIYMSTPLDTTLKHNVALALTIRKASVLHFDLSCSPCILKEVGTIEQPRDEYGKLPLDRYIINIAPKSDYCLSN